MSYDKTCCGTTCDAKANAEYVAKLEELVSELVSCCRAAEYWGGRYDMNHLGHLVLETVDDYEEVIKHAQQNNSTNGAS